MIAQTLLNELKARGIRIEPRPERKLHLTPKANLNTDLLEAVRQHKPTLLAHLRGTNGFVLKPRLLEKEDLELELSILPASLVAIADAIAAVPRSPFLNDLALAKAAASFVVAERAAQAALPFLSAEIRNL